MQNSSDHLDSGECGRVQALVPADEAAEFVKLVLDDCGFHVWSEDGNTVIGVRPPRENVRHYADFMKAADWLVKYGYADWDASVTPEHLHFHAERVTTNQECKGRNCGSTNQRLHSAECFAEHEATIDATAAHEPTHRDDCRYWKSGDFCTCGASA